MEIDRRQRKIDRGMEEELEEGKKRRTKKESKERETERRWKTVREERKEGDNEGGKAMRGLEGIGGRSGSTLVVVERTGRGRIEG